jgi:hypothetical protein
MLYLRRVNPGRVHLSTDLTVDDSGAAQMGLGAEFMLKQSKLHFGVNSDLLLRSYLETSLSQSAQFQLSAEMMQASNHYRFGFGLLMG